MHEPPPSSLLPTTHPTVLRAEEGQDGVTLPRFLRFFSARAGLARALEAPGGRAAASPAEETAATVLHAAQVRPAPPTPLPY